MLAIGDAAHAEHGDPSENYVIVPVSCPVSNRAEGAPNLSGPSKVRIRPGSRLFSIYQREAVEEEYFCNYEVNGRYLAGLESAGLKAAAEGERGEVRAVELAEKSFFIATLFLPQLSSREGGPHPVIVAYLDAARGRAAQVI